MKERLDQFQVLTPYCAWFRLASPFRQATVDEHLSRLVRAQGELAAVERRASNQDAALVIARVRRVV